MMESFNEELGKLISDKWTKAAVDSWFKWRGMALKRAKSILRQIIPMQPLQWWQVIGGSL